MKSTKHVPTSPYLPRNLQRSDPRTNGPRKNLSIKKRSIATYVSRGPLGFGPIRCLMDTSMVKKGGLQKVDSQRFATQDQQ